MIVILEGAERTGKTTIAKMLENKGFLYIKDSIRLYNGNLDRVTVEETTNRIDTAVNYLEKLSETNENIVVDRLHISNAVFAKYYRKRVHETYINFYDTILSHLKDVKLFLFERTIDESYLDEHPVYGDEESLKNLIDAFRYYYSKSKIKNKAIFNFKNDNPEYILEYIMEKYPFDEIEEPNEKIISSNVKTRDPEIEEEKYDFYLASPFFNPEQVERMNKVLDILRRYNYKVYAPMEHGVVKADDTKEFANLVFKENCRAINNSLKVIAITDGKDMGTIWEAGYAYGRGIPVVYYAETLGDNPFNLMLAESGIGIYRDGLALDASAFTHNFEFKVGVKYE